MARCRSCIIITHCFISCKQKGLIIRRENIIFASNDMTQLKNDHSRTFERVHYKSCTLTTHVVKLSIELNMDNSAAFVYKSKQQQRLNEKMFA